MMTRPYRYTIDGLLEIADFDDCASLRRLSVHHVFVAINCSVDISHCVPHDGRKEDLDFKIS